MESFSLTGLVFTPKKHYIMHLGKCLFLSQYDFLKYTRREGLNIKKKLTFRTSLCFSSPNKLTRFISPYFSLNSSRTIRLGPSPPTIIKTSFQCYARLFWHDQTLGKSDLHNLQIIRFWNDLSECPDSHLFLGSVTSKHLPVKSQQ